MISEVEDNNHFVEGAGFLGEFWIYLINRSSEKLSDVITDGIGWIASKDGERNIKFLDDRLKDSRHCILLGHYLDMNRLI